MSNTKVQQIAYKPKKEKIALIEPEKQISGTDVLDYLGNKLWDQRVFILVTVLIVENVFLLVRMG